MAYCGPTPIADEGSMMARPRRCRICRKGPPWQYRNCPPGVYKRCYHAEVWPDRPAARRQRRLADAISAAAGDPLEAVDVLPNGSVTGWDGPNLVLALAVGDVVPLCPRDESDPTRQPLPNRRTRSPG